ncbi:DEAD/DEAH box helicase, partial [Enterococcus faecalis]|nr:DEAD/DEAH box helicase [Enterococcus faecalis]
LKDGASVIGISPTGSGKTLAYLLPLLTKVEKKQGNQLLILTSSQELAMQVTEVAREWAQAIGLTVLPLIGGASTKRQVEKLKDKPEVLIG